MVLLSKQCLLKCNVLSLEIECSLTQLSSFANLKRYQGKRVIDELAKLNLVTIEKKTSQKNSPLSIKLTNKFFTDLCGIKTDLDLIQKQCLYDIAIVNDYYLNEIEDFEWPNNINGLSALYFHDLEYIKNLKNKLRIQRENLKKQLKKCIFNGEKKALESEIKWIEKILKKRKSTISKH